MGFATPLFGNHFLSRQWACATGPVAILRSAAVHHPVYETGSPAACFPNSAFALLGLAPAVGVQALMSHAHLSGGGYPSPLLAMPGIYSTNYFFFDGRNLLTPCSITRLPVYQRPGNAQAKRKRGCDRDPANSHVDPRESLNDALLSTLQIGLALPAAGQDGWSGCMTTSSAGSPVRLLHRASLLAWPLPWSTPGPSPGQHRLPGGQPSSRSITPAPGRSRRISAAKRVVTNAYRRSLLS